MGKGGRERGGSTRFIVTKTLNKSLYANIHNLKSLQDKTEGLKSKLLR